MFEYTLCTKCKIRKLESRITELENYVDYLEAMVMKYELDIPYSEAINDENT